MANAKVLGFAKGGRHGRRRGEDLGSRREHVGYVH